MLGRKLATNVIPAKAGIQEFMMVAKALDPGFRRGDDYIKEPFSSLPNTARGIMDTRFRGYDNFL
jgi:hypothetical protein